MLSRMAPSSPPDMRTLHLLRTPDILCANDNRPLVSNKLSNSRAWFWPWRCLVTEEVNDPLVCKVGFADNWPLAQLLPSTHSLTEFGEVCLHQSMTQIGR